MDDFRDSTHLEEPTNRDRPCGEEILTCLLAATRELHSADTLSEGLEKVADRVNEAIPYDTFAVLLIDDLGRDLKFAVARGYSSEVMEHWRFGMGQGVVGKAAQGREVIRIEDVREDNRYIDASVLTRSELAIPLVVGERTIGVLDVGSSQAGYFTPEDERLLGILSDNLASAIEQARLYENIKSQAQSLSLLHEVSRKLTSILDRDQLLRRVAKLVKRLIPYDTFTVLLWNEETQLLEPTIAVFEDGLRLDRASSLPLGTGICGNAASLRQPIRVANVHLDPRFISCVGSLEVQSELAVPLLLKDQLMGVVDLESVEYNAFSDRDEQLLSTLASYLAIALENARLYDKLRRDEQRLELDLRTARRIQRQLLPKNTPIVPNLEVAVRSEPARHLGGDFYDFLDYDDDRVAIAVGDVSGKATSAALYGSFAIGRLREFADDRCLDPAQVLVDMNTRLHSLGINNRFLAMVYSVYDAKDRSLLLANSGLPYPYLLRDRKLEKIEADGMPLGLFPNRTYEQLKLDLQPGDVIVIASDGIEEATNLQDEAFGRDRVELTLRQLADRSAEDIATGLLAAVRRFDDSEEPSDDRTVVALKAV